MYPSKQSLTHYLLAMVAAVALCTGCNRRTPEERLQKAVEFLQQNDTLSAEVEAKKVVEKTPDDPSAVQARILLAQIYTRDNRFDEASAELEPILDKVSQKDPLGQAVLKNYLLVLQREKKYDDALKTIDRFQQKYGDDEGTSLNLTVARADTQIMAGQTTPARELLFHLRESTTSPAVLDLYRGLIASTYQRDRDTTGAIGFFEKELAGAKTNDDKRVLASQLAGLYAANEDYAKTREYTAQVTTLIDDALTTDNMRLQQALTFDIGRLYLVVGNYPGARQVLQALFDSAPQEQQMIMQTVGALAESLIRQGDAPATIGFLKEASTRYPTAPFGQQAATVESLRQQGKLANMQDTSTLALKFKGDQLLVPKNLPKPAQTSGTLTAAGGTSTTIVGAAMSAETASTASAVASPETQTSAPAESATTTSAQDSSTSK